MVAVCGCMKFGEYIGSFIEVKGKAVPAVGLFHGPTYHSGRSTTYDDGRSRLLHCMGMGLHSLKRDILSVIGGLFLAPDGTHGRQVLIRASASFVEGHAQRLVLCLRPPDANPYHQAATGEYVQAGQFLRQDERMVLRK